MTNNSFADEFLNNCYLGDLRRTYVASELVNAISNSGSVVLNSISSSRAQQIRFQRFLENEFFSTQDLLDTAYDLTEKNSKKSEHVLAIQDSTEIAIHRENDIDKSKLGVLKSKDKCGLHLHPVLVVDPQDNFVSGIASAMDFSYELPREKYIKYQEVEFKKSYRWIESAQNAKENLRGAKKVTFVGDRENDIYQYYCRVPEDKFHVLVRAKKQKTVKLSKSGEAISLENFHKSTKAQGKIALDLRSRAGADNRGLKEDKPKRKKRKATLEIRFNKVIIGKPTNCKSNDPKEIELWLVNVTEVGYEGKDSINWHLLTSHNVGNIEKAIEIVNWYQKRWHIEQYFRTIKRQGLKLEQIELSNANSIRRMAMLALISAIKILQLTLCRDGEINRDAKILFSQRELKVLKLLNTKLQGKTSNQRNPHKAQTLAWSHWIIGRLGGWKGKTKHGGPAGPKSLKRGLDRFNQYVEALSLFSDPNVCIT